MRLPSSLHRALLLTLVVIGSTGCRSGMSGFDTAWKRPDLSGLAFWKKPDSAVPSPPAVHFDPTPAGNDKLARQTNPVSKGSQEQELKNSLDKLAEFEKKANDSTQSDLPKGSPMMKGSEGLVRDALDRSPQQLSEKSTALAAAKEPKVGDFKASTSKELNGLSPNRDFLKNAAKSQVDQSTEVARSEFNAAMQNNSSASTREIASVKNGPNELSRDFQPANPSIGQSTNGTNQLSNSMVTSKTKSQLDDTFPKTESPSNSNRLSGLADREQEKLNQMGARSNAGNGQLSSEQQRLETEVARAQREISELKAQLTNRTQQPLTGPKPNPSNQLQPVESQTTRTGQLAPLDNLQRPSFSQNSNPLTSLKRDDGLAAIKPNGSAMKPIPELSKPAAPASPSPYATTSQGAFAPIQPMKTGSSPAPSSTIEQVGLNSQVNSTEPTDRYAANPKDHISEVAIPDSVLQGKGSFAPGSVNRLRGQ